MTEKRTKERTETHACDCISRQAAIEALKRAEALTRAFGYHHVIETIRELPTADLSEYSDKLWKTAYERGKAEAHPKNGKWIDGNEGKWNAVYCPKCSVCGTPFYGIETVRYHYCPNCGARMEERDEAD